jgi:hypothetical protein
MLSAAFPPLSNAVGQGVVFLGFAVVGVGCVVSLFFLLPGKAEVDTRHATRDFTAEVDGVHVQERDEEADEYSGSPRSREPLVFHKVVDDGEKYL